MASSLRIPVSAIVAAKNEEARIAKCLEALGGFEEIMVVDSMSSDRTKEIAAACGAKVFDFKWNGAYPKKRQWILDNLLLQHEWVFFVDADEIVTDRLKAEIAALDFAAAGYFVRGAYVYEGRVLRHGLKNNKLALFDRRRMAFPVVDDLDLPGMGEMEGHYQPVLTAPGRVGQLKHCLLHDAFDDPAGWQARHENYAAWERGMRARGKPGEVNLARRAMKGIFRSLPFRPVLAFLHCYLLKRGFLDGGRGFRFARRRYDYYRMIGS